MARLDRRSLLPRAEVIIPLYRMRSRGVCSSGASSGTTSAERLAEVPAVGIQDRQFQAAAGGVALAAAVIAGYRRQLQSLGQGDGLGEITAGFQLRRQVGRLEQSQRRGGRFAGDVYARHPFTKALHAVGKNTANQQILRLHPSVRAWRMVRRRGMRMWYAVSSTIFKLVLRLGPGQRVSWRTGPGGGNTMVSASGRHRAVFLVFPGTIHRVQSIQE